MGTWGAGFGGWLRDGGYSPRTVDLYVREVTRIERWLKVCACAPLRCARKQDLAEYVRTEVPRTYASRKNARQAVVAYLRGYLGHRQIPPEGIWDLPRRPDYHCRALEDGQLEKVLVAALELGPTYHAAIVLMYYLALRREEAAHLRWDAFGADGWVRIVGKGRREARLPVRQEVLDALRALPYRHHASEWVFPGRTDGRPISPATLNVWVRIVAAAAGILSLQPHRLRHTALAVANDETGQLRAVSEFARHRHVSTTMVYTRTKAAALREVVAAL